MRHIKQNDPDCLPVMQKIGCFVRSCGLVAEYHTGKSLSAGQINELWETAKRKGFVNGSDDVVASAPIINLALRMLGDKGRFIEVGIFAEGKTSYYPSVQEKYRSIDALIQKIKQSGPSGTHFRLVDKAGYLIEDPHDPEIKVKGICYSILYHYIGG